MTLSTQKALKSIFYEKFKIARALKALKTIDIINILCYNFVLDVIKAARDGFSPDDFDKSAGIFFNFRKGRIS